MYYKFLYDGYTILAIYIIEKYRVNRSVRKLIYSDINKILDQKREQITSRFFFFHITVNRYSLSKKITQ